MFFKKYGRVIVGIWGAVQLGRGAEVPSAPEKLPGAASLRRAVQDLSGTYAKEYPKGPLFLKRLAELEKRALTATQDEAATLAGDFSALKMEALLANPLLDFDRLLLVRRNPEKMGLPYNWQGNCALAKKAAYDNEIDVLSPVSPAGTLTPLFKPEPNVFVGDIDLHFDAGRMLFSMPASNNTWQVWEIQADGSGLRQVSAGVEPDVDNYGRFRV